MPPKAKSPAKKAPAKKSASKPEQKRSKSRPKKGPKTKLAQDIIALRDKLIADGLDSEKVHMACKGMYKCDKLADEKCLKDIMAKLESVKKGGAERLNAILGGRKPRSKSRGRSRSKKRSKSKSKSKARK